MFCVEKRRKALSVGALVGVLCFQIPQSDLIPYGRTNEEIWLRGSNVKACSKIMTLSDHEVQSYLNHSRHSSLQLYGESLMVSVNGCYRQDQQLWSLSA